MVEMLPQPMMPTPSVSMPCSPSGPGGHGFARAASETGDVVRSVVLGDVQRYAGFPHRGAQRRPVHDAVAGIGLPDEIGRLLEQAFEKGRAAIGLAVFPVMIVPAEPKPLAGDSLADLI